MTGADRQWAAPYEAGDIMRYTRDSQAVAAEAGEYVRVASVDREENLLTVERRKPLALQTPPMVKSSS